MNAAAQKLVKHSFTVDVEVPSQWIDYVLQSSPFMWGNCRYWLADIIAHERANGAVERLVWEHNDATRLPLTGELIEAWEAGVPLERLSHLTQGRHYFVYEWLDKQPRVP